MSKSNKYSNQLVKASLKYVRISPLKLRKVADTVRYLSPEIAMQRLRLMPQKGADILYKLIHSCVANASHNFDIAATNLKIQTLMVNEGPRMKRFQPRARGRMYAIHKPFAHVELILKEEGGSHGSKS
jgi:large subunit ribosomal protein L22